MSGAADTDGCAKMSNILNPWQNPKLTLGEAMDLRIKRAREEIERLCIQKAKLEVIDWLKLPYHDTMRLLDMRENPF